MSATSEAGAVATQAEERRKAKYISLAATYSFCPIAIETSGVLGPHTAMFIRDFGSRLREVTGEDKAHVYLLQRLVVAVMRGNAVSVLKTI